MMAKLSSEKYLLAAIKIIATIIPSTFIGTAIMLFGKVMLSKYVKLNRMS